MKAPRTIKCASREELDEFLRESGFQNSGTYVVELFASAEFEIAAKLFAGEIFSKGYYYYFGSAQKNFSARIIRHVSKNKKIHWHIDYLTTNPSVKIKRLFLYPGAEKKMECRSYSASARLSPNYIPVKNFGSGDCDTCGSHLLYSKKRAPQSHFISLYQSIVLLIPSSSDTF